MVKERAVIVSQKCIGTDIYDMVLSFPKGAKGSEAGTVHCHVL